MSTPKSTTNSNPTPTGIEEIGGYSVPIDPMDDLSCDSCQ